jgi:hypothetical protein
MTLQSRFDDSYHIRNLVVELGDFWIVPDPVHTTIGHGRCQTMPRTMCNRSRMTWTHLAKSRCQWIQAVLGNNSKGCAFSLGKMAISSEITSEGY